ncbi:unnamed protein product [Durusdinium trenchii]|uniref:Uncharacterized protein n=1 Tax=Durusdinium trenchii TaxID=1381693 RepID=A0ABP0JKD0_9DINO
MGQIEEIPAPRPSRDRDLPELTRSPLRPIPFGPVHVARWLEAAKQRSTAMAAVPHPGSLRLDSTRRRVFEVPSPRSQVTPRGTLVSALHPETHRDFHYSGKRQAYGSVSPLLENLKQSTAMGIRECQEDARNRWFKAYAEGRSEQARSTREQLRTERTLGSSSLLGHTEESAQGWVWHSWRGWTASSRHQHEQQMRQIWQQEARERWLKANGA